MVGKNVAVASKQVSVAAVKQPKKRVRFADDPKQIEPAPPEKRPDLSKPLAIDFGESDDPIEFVFRVTVAKHSKITDAAEVGLKYIKGTLADYPADRARPLQIAAPIDKSELKQKNDMADVRSKAPKGEVFIGASVCCLYQTLSLIGSLTLCLVIGLFTGKGLTHLKDACSPRGILSFSVVMMECFCHPTTHFVNHSNNILCFLFFKGETAIFGAHVFAPQKLLASLVAFGNLFFNKINFKH